MAPKGAVRDYRSVAEAGNDRVSVARPLTGRPRLPAASWLCCLLAVFIVVQYLLPLGTAVQIGADEGFELAKTELCLTGHKLYSDVWNDQPPLHTFLLTKLVSLTEPGKLKELSSSTPQAAGMVRPAHSVLWPRLLTSGFTVLLLVSFFGLVRRVHGLFVAVLATGLLMVSPGFIELSASCMLEIPALALAVCGMKILQERTEGTEKGRDEKGRKAGIIRLVLAGILFGLALQIKLVPMFLMPLVAVMIYSSAECGSQKDTNFRNSNLTAKNSKNAEKFSMQSTEGEAVVRLGRFLFRAGAFGVGLVVAYVGIDLLIEGGAYLANFKQSWTSHFGTAKSFEYGSADDHPFDWGILLRNWDTTVPALVGIIVLLRLALRRGTESQMAGKQTGSLRYSRTDGGTMVRATALGKTFQPSALKLSLPVLWLFLSLAVFTLHKPWWPYYYIHLAIPLSWCAAIGISAALRTALASWSARAPAPLWVRTGPLRFVLGSVPAVEGTSAGPNQPRRSKAAQYRPHSKTWRRFGRANRGIALVVVLGVLLLCAGAWQITRVYLQVSLIRRCPKIYYSLALAEIEKYKPSVQWMYADESVYSYLAGIPMPPSLAVVPLKRLWSGEMTNERIVAEMEKYRPGIVMLKTSTTEVPFGKLLGTEYRLVYQDADQKIYLRRGI
jgi:hypothetical protein